MVHDYPFSARAPEIPAPVEYSPFPGFNLCNFRPLKKKKTGIGFFNFRPLLRFAINDLYAPKHTRVVWNSYHVYQVVYSPG